MNDQSKVGDRFALVRDCHFSNAADIDRSCDAGTSAASRQDRAEFVRNWIVKNQRKIVAGALGVIAMTPAVANAAGAAPDGFVAVADMPGLSSYVVLDDGSVRLTFADGRTVIVASENAQVLGDGQVLISAGAAETLLVAEGAGGSGALIAAGGAALAAAAAGGASSAAAPVPENPVDLMNGEAYVTSDTNVRARIDGTVGEKVFAIDAPNAERIEITGIATDQPDQLILKIRDIADDTRTLTLVTDAMEADEGPHRIVFDFSGVDGDENDVVTLAPDSILTGFNEIEVVSGTLNVLGIELPAGTVFIVNSGLVLSLEQFMATASITSVTGHGQITVALDNEGQADTLNAFLADSGSFILIGAQVSVEVAGVPVTDTGLSDAIDAITFPSIPEIDGLITELQGNIDALSGSTDLSVEELTTSLGTLSGELTTLTGQVTALETLVGETPVSAQITTAINALTVTLEAADVALGARIDTLASDLSTQATTLQGNIDALSGSTDLSVEELTTSLGTLSGELTTLTGQVTALETLVGETPVSEQITTAIAGMKEALGAPATGEGTDATPATGLFALIAEVEARLDALEAEPIAWTSEGLAFTAAEIFGSDTSSAILTTFITDFNAVIAGYDTATIPMTITTDLTVAQATALSQAGFVLDGVNVTYAINDYYTTVQAALADPDQNAALTGATEAVAKGDELDNALAMTAFDQSVNLRIMADDGDDAINAGRGDDVIVGGDGADTINLTFRDTSADAVVYQDVTDGGGLPVTALNFSADANDYRVGSELSVMVNDHLYTYTTVEDETAESALGALALSIRYGEQSILTAQVQPGGVINLVGAQVGTDIIVADTGEGVPFIANKGQLHVKTVTFDTEPASYIQDATFTRQISVTIAGVKISADMVAGDPAGSVSNLVSAINTARADNTDDGAALTAAIAEVGFINVGAAITLVAANVYTTDDADTFTVTAPTLDVAGAQQQSETSFSTDSADYFEGGQLRVTIAGHEIVADMVAGDANASVAALQAAIEVARVGVVTEATLTIINDAISLVNVTGAETVADISNSLNIGGTSFDAIGLAGLTLYEVVNALSDQFSAYGTASIVDGDVVFTMDSVSSAINVSGTLSVFSDGNIEIASISSDGVVRAGTEIIDTSEGSGFIAGLADVLEGVELGSDDVLMTAESAFTLENVIISYTFGADIAASGMITVAAGLSFEAHPFGEYNPFTLPSGEFADLDSFIAAIGSQLQDTTNIGTAFSYELGAETLKLTFTSEQGYDLYPQSIGITSIVDAPSLILTAATEAVDPLAVTGAELDYFGALQKATVTFSPASADYYEGGTLSITINPVDLGGTPVTITADMLGTTSDKQWTSVGRLKTAIDAILTDTEHADHEALSAMISGVSQNETTLTFMAATPAAELFTLSEAELSYAGIQQQATADFSTDNADYYAGGEIGLMVNGAPITADMAAGSAALSLAALTAAITAATADAAPAQVTVVMSGGGVTEDSAISGTTSVVFNDSVTKLFGASTIGGLITDIEYEFSDLAVSLDTDGNLVFELSPGSKLTGVAVSGNVTIKTSDTNTQVTNFDGSAENVAQGALFGQINPAELNGSTITLTATNPVDGTGEISIGVQVTTIEAVAQVTEIDFGGTSDDSFRAFDDAGVPGTISVTIGGVEITADMADTKQGTINNLSAKIAAANTSGGTIQGLLDRVESDDQDIFIYAKVGGVDPLEVSALSYATESVADSTPQIVDVTFANGTLDDPIDTPLGTVVSITVAGITSSVTIWDDSNVPDSITAYVNVTGLTNLRSETIMTALAAQVEANHNGSALGAVQQGFIDPATGDFIPGTGSGTNSLRVTAENNGALTLGAVTATVAVDSVAIPGAALIDPVQEGHYAFAGNTTSVGIAILDVQTGADEFTTSITATDEVNTAGLNFDNSVVAGVNDDPAPQPTDNASVAGKDPGQYGDDGLYVGGVLVTESDTTKIDTGDLVAGVAESQDAQDAATTTVNGFAAFEDTGGRSIVYLGGDADVVNNFQVEHDVIALEADLAGSTYDGGIDYRALTTGAAFDLSTFEFGLVGHAVSNVSETGLSNNNAVSNLIGDMLGTSVTNDNGQINTSVFAITASDNSDVTAIWAHTQSSSGDSTVSADELRLLATVNTIGGDFSASNLDILGYDPQAV